MKTMKIKLSLLATLFCLAALTASAQEKKPEMPDAIKNFIRFQGKWDAEVVMTLNGKPNKVSYHVACRRVADGSGFYMDEWFNDSTLGNLKGGNLFGYNPYDKKIHWFSVDNMGTCHEHVGEWKTPDHFYMEYNGMQDGKKYVEKIDMTLKDANNMDFKLTATLDAKEVQRVEGTFIKNVPVGGKK
jgi:hypothetical protein